MKSMLYAQLNPVKTMDQLLNDRSLFRGFMLVALIIACFL